MVNIQLIKNVIEALEKMFNGEVRREIPNVSDSCNFTKIDEQSFTILNMTVGVYKYDNKRLIELVFTDNGEKTTISLMLDRPIFVVYVTQQIVSTIFNYMYLEDVIHHQPANIAFKDYSMPVIDDGKLFVDAYGKPFYEDNESSLERAFRKFVETHEDPSEAIAEIMKDSKTVSEAMNRIAQYKRSLKS